MFQVSKETWKVGNFYLVAETNCKLFTIRVITKKKVEHELQNFSLKRVKNKLRKVKPFVRCTYVYMNISNACLLNIIAHCTRYKDTKIPIRIYFSFEFFLR